jgi:nitroreductase
MRAMSVMLDILDLARWAPSGDNSQPWRFEVLADDEVIVHAFDTRRHCVYDLEGHASQLSVGALLETMRIAASAHQRVARVTRRESPAEAPVFDVRFELAPALPADDLHLAIRARSVARRPLSVRRLRLEERQRLESAVGDGYRVVWFESARERLRLAWLAVKSAKIRLTIPEAYAVHRQIIEWNARYSEDRVPDQALGADPLSLRSMRWVMASWDRVQMMNRFFGGTLAPRLQLDLLPGLLCAAHFALVARRPPQDSDDFLAAGAAVQRFWLTATTLGLQLQPQYTPLVFADYARTGVKFTSVESARRRAGWVERRLALLLGEQGAPATVFLGRLGQGRPHSARSLRLPLDRLMVGPP